MTNSTFSRLLNLSLSLCIALISCVKEEVPSFPKDLAEDSLIPLPVEVQATGKSYQLNEQTQISYTDASLKAMADNLGQYIRKGTDFKTSVSQQVKGAKNKIHLNLTDSISQPEGYVLDIDKWGIQLSARTPAGIFYGIQSLRQLFPVSFEQQTATKDTVRIASGIIKDYPSYAYRGAMLDVARHFFEVEDVKRFIDLMAGYKMNKLHLHLSDDQGWRIEIKSWPNLTTHGGSTQVGGGTGGFYTQEEYKAIVAYATERFITIIPEIDMPGHTNAALASYPELNCDGKATQLYTGTRVGFSTLCTDKEITYRFVDDVVREITAMTPGTYFHIGGDESHVTPLKDYIPFINRVSKIVEKYDRRVMGWDEIAHANVDSTSVVQFWAEGENALRAIKKGAKILMSPAKRAYLDMKYDSLSRLGLNWAAYIEVDQGYNWALETYEEGIQKEHILGIEAPLWSETISTMDDIEYLAFPRIMGIAEIGWTAASQRNWENYKQRLAKQQARLDAMNVDYYRSTKVPWPHE